MRPEETDCGKRFQHDPHAFRTSRGKIKACDGSTTKRQVRRDRRY